MEKTDADQDAKTTPESKESVDPEKVHSANSWESADLGDDDRRKKFLRLMGAAKKEHHGRFVIGDQEASGTHGRSKDKTEEITKNLEDQFDHGMEHKFAGGYKSHIGLGFSDGSDEKRDQEKTESCKETAEEEDKKDNVTDKNKEAATESSQNSAQKHPLDNKEVENGEPKSKMMKFVKASS